MSKKIVSGSAVAALIEFMVERHTLNQIHKMFGHADIALAEDHVSKLSGERRSLADQYIASLDLTDPEDADRLLEVFAEVLTWLQDWLDKFEPEEEGRERPQREMTILQNHLRRDGFEYRDGCIVPLRQSPEAEHSAAVPSTQATGDQRQRKDSYAMNEQEQHRLDERLEQIGVERLLADQSNDFISTVGGPIHHRIYAGEWLSKALASRRQTERLLSQGKKAFRDQVLVKLHQQTDGKANAAYHYTVFARDIGLEAEEVGNALDYWEDMGLVQVWGMGSYAMTHRGNDVVEKALANLAKEEEATVKPHGKGVFIGHGRSHLWHVVKTHLTDDFGADTHTFERHKMAGAQVIPTLEKLLDACGFAVIVATGEDKSEEGLRARQNVVHETGLFQGKLGFGRVAILTQNRVETYSNLSGLLVIPFDGDHIEQTFSELDKVLRHAGYTYT